MRSSCRGRLSIGSACGLLLWVSPAFAYVGPGAGFAFVSIFSLLWISLLLSVFGLAVWPVRRLIRLLVRRAKARPRIKRLVIVGLDGQDPDLTEKLMDEGLLPNFSRLRQRGCFRRLATTLPAESPVAWSSFQTGCNPGKHRIFDFLVPDRRAMRPQLCSRVGSPGRVLRLGKFRIPLGRPVSDSGRRSKPFWQILGEHGVFSSILRVPLTFPPEPFDGVLLAGMCLPDLTGSQGTYFYYTSDPRDKRELTSGIQLPLQLTDDGARGALSGPDNPLVAGGGALAIDFELRLKGMPADAAELCIDGHRWPLRQGEYSPWIRLAFKPGLSIRLRGLCRFLLLETQPHVRLYVTPLQLDPEHPALPISHPSIYSSYLAKSRDVFATLGVAEDTSALNEGIIDEDAFLSQCQLIHQEREQMFFDALDKTPRGAVVCVFDITDRVQHMFLRCMDGDHPANRGREWQRHRHVVRDLYVQMDKLLGRVLDRIGDDELLMVMSDHGFKQFRRGVNLNTWLRRKGYQVVGERGEGVEGGEVESPEVKSPEMKSHGGDMLRQVTWSKTRAYALGFGGIYLNLRGREAHGIVRPGAEADSLKRQIASELLELRDDDGDGERPVAAVYDTQEAYRGPYTDEAPDLIVGFRPGYRVSWSTVTGGGGATVVEDNTRAWGADHSMDPPQVPGMLFCNRRVAEENPRIIDLAPTALDQFGIAVPGYLDGAALTLSEE